MADWICDKCAESNDKQEGYCVHCGVSQDWLGWLLERDDYGLVSG